jgi:hypothetical protein
MRVHCPSRLSTAATVLSAEIPCGDGVFAEWALKRGQAVNHFDVVMSHSSNCRRSSWNDSELKLRSPPVTTETSDVRAHDPGNEQDAILQQQRWKATPAA